MPQWEKLDLQVLIIEEDRGTCTQIMNTNPSFNLKKILITILLKSKVKVCTLSHYYQTFRVNVLTIFRVSYTSA
jgi:hypothetical protein